MSVAFHGNFLGGKKTLQRPNFFFNVELMMFDWGLLFFSNHFLFLAKSQGWQNSVTVRVLICGDAPVSVKLEREKERYRRF